ncbi:DUF4145 domain-containing protein [Atlantibacter sp.]|uniref:DUF4145 domain-containing protein n=1 Tax=Atlantibacter sp. TaxID=1903473 RepID=UPI0028A7176D|nr:DUF4145 domain-containing protein [Atlantibacter sp.]
MANVTWSEPEIKTEGLSNTSNECHICKRFTHHKSLVKINFSETCDAEDEYSNSETYYQQYEIIQCQGCMQPSLKIERCSSDDINYNSYEPNISTEYYPKRSELAQFEGAGNLPKALYDMYNETIIAINSECYTIAGIGIRGLIETICKEEKIEDYYLNDKIDKLFSVGRISSDSKDILHSLRKLYNKSAHESFKPSLQQLNVSLDVIELLMKQIYIHSYQAKQHFPGKKPDTD